MNEHDENQGGSGGAGDKPEDKKVEKPVDQEEEKDELPTDPEELKKLLKSEREEKQKVLAKNKEWEQEKKAAKKAAEEAAEKAKKAEKEKAELSGDKEAMLKILQKELEDERNEKQALINKEKEKEAKLLADYKAKALSEMFKDYKVKDLKRLETVLREEKQLEKMVIETDETGKVKGINEMGKKQILDFALKELPYMFEASVEEPVRTAPGKAKTKDNLRDLLSKALK